MTDFNTASGRAAEQDVGLANRLERLMERLTPLNALVVTLTSGFLLLLFAFVLGLDDRFHESCHKRGIHLGFRTPI
jgi:hypothetical protein